MVVLVVSPGVDLEIGERRPNFDRCSPREVNNIVLAGLNPASPSASVKVNLLEPPRLLLLHHLYHVGACELDGGAGFILILGFRRDYVTLVP